jgi:hypothetical protein
VKVLGDGSNTQGYGEKLEHYAGAIAQNLEELSGKLIETKKAMQKDIVQT